jgi:hypothetical protein
VRCGITVTTFSDYLRRYENGSFFRNEEGTERDGLIIQDGEVPGGSFCGVCVWGGGRTELAADIKKEKENRMSREREGRWKIEGRRERKRRKIVV